MMEAERMMEDAELLEDDSTVDAPIPVAEPAARGTKSAPRGRVVVLLPALNEEQAIGGVLDRIPRVRLEAISYAVFCLKKKKRSAPSNKLRKYLACSRVRAREARTTRC